MINLNGMESAPKDGTIVMLVNNEHKVSAPMAWDKKLRKWIGREFTPMGSVRTYWDMALAKPDGWIPIGPAN